VIGYVRDPRAGRVWRRRVVVTFNACYYNEGKWQWGLTSAVHASSKGPAWEDASKVKAHVTTQGVSYREYLKRVKSQYAIPGGRGLGTEADATPLQQLILEPTMRFFVGMFIVNLCQVNPPL